MLLKNALIIVIIGLVGYGGYRLIRSLPGGETFTPAPVHWHGFLTMSVCGEARDIRDRNHDSPGVKSVGNALLHTHGDNWIHIEGRVLSASDISLLAFFNALKIPFGTDHFFDKQGSSACNDGNPDLLRVKVNGADIADPVNYVVRDQDKIEISFH